MSALPRKFHRKVVPWIVLPLLVFAITGLSAGLGSAWFGVPKETVWKILDIHAGEWLGGPGSAVYVAVFGGLLLTLIATGVLMLSKSRAKVAPRPFHRAVGLLMSLPLILAAVTGITYRVGEEFFSLPEEAEHVLMKIHQGGWLPPVLHPFYILLMGAGLLSMIWTGVTMTGWLRRKPAGSKPQP